MMKDSDRRFQFELLHGVARTFALTIPQLPAELVDVVANAYLLCRIADTIEDETGIDTAQKCALAEQFIDVVAGQASAEDFAQRFTSMLSARRLPAEKQLIQHASRVVGITHEFNTAQQAALTSCVTVMSKGMVYYQANASLGGLLSMNQFNNYCYHVAGVVGEMLTALWCEAVPEMMPHQDRLQQLAVSFAQGLQMTNVLKDIWEDYRRGVCWLPRDIFKQAGFNLDHLAERHQSEAFERGMKQLIQISRAHLDNAVAYLELVPPRQTGIRKFCLWAIAMALLTMANIYRRPNFDSGDQVKISRFSVLSVIGVSRFVVSSQRLSEYFLNFCARRLPTPATVEVNTQHADIQNWFSRQSARA